MSIMSYTSSIGSAFIDLRSKLSLQAFEEDKVQEPTGDADILALPRHFDYLTLFRLKNMYSEGNISGSECSYDHRSVSSLDSAQHLREIGDNMLREANLKTTPELTSTSLEKPMQEPIENHSLIFTITKVDRKLEKMKGCNCKRSKCLKLYCDCFAAGVCCRPDCQCKSCYNTEDCESKRMTARKCVTVKDSISEVEYGTRSKNIPGCKCVKSACKQNYCFCLRKGLKCGSRCQCQGCANGKSKI